MGKIIVIEGTDGSGKKTQSELLWASLRKENMAVSGFSFPMYETPTGKIVGGPYLGKSEIGNGWFPEGSPNVDYRVASLYYIADRLYNIDKVNDALKEGHVILDRYVYSNMAHQGGKLIDHTERFNFFQFIDTLEFQLLKLPKPDICIFLHMPYQKTIELMQNRNLDQNERDSEQLKHAEQTYLELASVYHWKVIECIDSSGALRSIEDIHNEVDRYVKRALKGLI